MPRERKRDRWTTISVHMSTYRALLEVQGAMQLMDGRRYTLDDVLKKMARAVTIEISRAVDRVKDKALRDVEEDHEQE